MVDSAVMSTNVQVAVRARPLNQRELDMESKVSVEMRNKSTVLFKTVKGVAVGQTRDDSKEFEYDHSYWSVDSHDTHFITQEQVYNDLGKSVLGSAFQGYNACVFAYGQTGSGKTHTMMGTEENPGLIPRICQSLYAHIANGNKMNVSYRVEASYLEIYNEKVRDLLEHSTPGKTNQLHRLKVREHPKEGPYVENLSRQNVGDFQEISRLMKLGNDHRVTASTKMNDVSSRSHAIFTILFTQATYSSDIPCETVSKIHLVDLAGSERVSATGAEGVRLKEGGNINRSLASLGNVISALADMSGPSRGGGGKKAFVPYRDSVLTWLLKDSLGGNSKTIMVATISPAEVNYGETLSTLRYASRAKNIVNKPIVNEDVNVKLIRELRTEIKRLKAIITAAKLQDCDLMATESALEENILKKEEMIEELTRSWAGKWDQGIQEMVADRNLALHSEGIKMTLASERPHLLAVDNDIFGGGIVIYHLESGLTTIGTIEATPSPDITLSGSDIQERHCAVESSEDRVTLVLADGKCFVNHVEVVKDLGLSHGDLVQLGEATVFRFNHPEEAQRMKQIDSTRRTSLLPLSPISPNISDTRTSDFEVEREALEKDYNVRMERLREELEGRRAEDKAKYVQEIEALRQLTMSTPTSDTQDDNDIGRTSAYNLLQSIAYTPVRTEPNIAERVVLGKESDEAQDPSPFRSPGFMNSYRSSETSSTANSSPEGVLRRTSITQNQVDEETVDISIVEKDADSAGEQSRYYATTKMQEYDDEEGKTCGDGANTDSDVEEMACDTRLQATASKLREKEEECEEIEKQKLEMESKLSQAQRKALSLRRHLQSEEEQWKKRVASLQKELISKDLPEDVRDRANAFGPVDSPKLRVNRHRQRRSQSANRSLRRNVRFKVEVPGCLLRGQGWGSYHVYELRVQLSSGRWSVYKSYAQFKLFYAEIVRRYSQLNLLSFPASKWFRTKNPEFVEQRRLELQTFIQSLIAICSTLPTCPLYDLSSRHMTKEKLCSFSSFFDSGDATGL